MGLALAALAGCGKKPPVFTGIDITGTGIGTGVSTGGATLAPLRLAGSDGREHALSDFKGKYVLLFFGFTQCPDVCPTALARSVEIRRLLGPDGSQVKVVFVTIDPERDTVALLAEYMRAFDPDFVGLRGDAAQTARIAADYKITYQKVPSGDSYTMDHTAITYVLDTTGQARLALKHDETAEQCAADLRALMHP